MLRGIYSYIYQLIGLLIDKFIQLIAMLESSGECDIINETPPLIIRNITEAKNKNKGNLLWLMTSKRPKKYYHRCKEAGNEYGVSAFKIHGETGKLHQINIFTYVGRTSISINKSENANILLIITANTTAH